MCSRWTFLFQALQVCVGSQVDIVLVLNVLIEGIWTFFGFEDV